MPHLLSYPPDLSLNMIKKLGTDLCQINTKLLSDENLNQRKKLICKPVAEIGPPEDAGKKKKKKQMKENKKPLADESSNDVQEEADAA